MTILNVMDYYVTRSEVNGPGKRFMALVQRFLRECPGCLFQPGLLALCP
jgi:hypothetical protein